MIHATEKLQRALRYAAYAALGRGGGFIDHKREYHQRRQRMEREFVLESRNSGSLVRANTCPACGGTDVSETFENAVGFRFDVCRADGTVFMNPVPSEESLARLYNHPGESYLWTSGRSDASPKVKPSDANDLEALLRFAPDKKGGELLDVGCATGGFLLTARAQFKVEGVELNEGTARIARAQGLSVTSGRLSDVEGTSRFDVITMLQVFEHIVNPADVLIDGLRLLRPGGILYLNLPAVEGASFQYLGHLHTHVTSFAHVSLYTKEGLRKVADRFGFSLESHEYCGGADLSLHDILTYRFNRERFVHRLAWYHPRLYFALNAIEEGFPSPIKRQLLPQGAESYQRAVFRKMR